MSAHLEIIEPGLAATIQDCGRRGWQRFGISASGMMDPVALGRDRPRLD
jgi:allophanate hydrolase subunit 2